MVTVAPFFRQCYFLTITYMHYSWSKNAKMTLKFSIFGHFCEVYIFSDNFANFWKTALLDIQFIKFWQFLEIFINSARIISKFWKFLEIFVNSARIISGNTDWICQIFLLKCCQIQKCYKLCFFKVTKFKFFYVNCGIF